MSEMELKQLVLRNAELEKECLQYMIKAATYEEIISSLESRIESQNIMLEGYRESLEEIKGLLYTIRENGNEQKEFIKHILTKVLEPALRTIQKETQDFVEKIAQLQAGNIESHIDGRLKSIFGDAEGNSFGIKLRGILGRVHATLDIVHDIKAKQLSDSANINEINTNVDRMKNGRGW